jgi:hypothetical protein
MNKFIQIFRLIEGPLFRNSRNSFSLFPCSNDEMWIFSPLILISLPGHHNFHHLYAQAEHLRSGRTTPHSLKLPNPTNLGEFDGKVKGRD